MVVYADKRMNFFVKQWLQARITLLLAAATLFGGIVYALVLQAILPGKIQVAASAGKGQAMDLWNVLYPIVTTATLILYLAGLLILYLILTAFTHRVSRGAAEVEEYFRLLLEKDTVPEGGRRFSPAEFNPLAEKTRRTVVFYRDRWSRLEQESRKAMEAAGTLDSASDPAARAQALLALEERMVSLKVQGPAARRSQP